LNNPLTEFSPEILVRTRKLSCERDHRLLFFGVDLELKQQELVELRGPNGCGKTTLLRCLAGLSHDYRGSIERAVKPLYIGHKGGLNPLLTPRENLTWYQSLQSGAPIGGQNIPGALERIGLAGYEDVPCQYMSAGQQRRTVLARLVLSPAPIWLLDEPLTALDSAGTALVRDLISQHASTGGCAVYATHQSLKLPQSTTLMLGS